MATARPRRCWRGTSTAVAQLEAADRARQTAVGALLGRRRADGGHDVVRGDSTSSGSRRGSPGTPGSCPAGGPIDPFPFSFLTLVVSLEAIFLVALRPDQPEQPHPAERAPGAPRPPDQPLGGAGIDEDGGAARADRPAIECPAPGRFQRAGARRADRHPRRGQHARERAASQVASGSEDSRREYRQ